MDTSTGYESLRAATAPQAKPRAQSARGRRQNISAPLYHHAQNQGAAEDSGQRPPKDSNLSNSTSRPRTPIPSTTPDRSRYHPWDQTCPSLQDMELPTAHMLLHKKMTLDPAQELELEVPKNDVD